MVFILDIQSLILQNLIYSPTLPNQPHSVSPSGLLQLPICTPTLTPFVPSHFQLFPIQPAVLASPTLKFNALCPYNKQTCFKLRSPELLPKQMTKIPSKTPCKEILLKYNRKFSNPNPAKNCKIFRK